LSATWRIAREEWLMNVAASGDQEYPAPQPEARRASLDGAARRRALRRRIDSASTTGRSGEPVGAEEGAARRTGLYLPDTTIEPLVFADAAKRRWATPGENRGST
jgi:hypothetical protein